MAMQMSKNHGGFMKSKREVRKVEEYSCKCD